MRKKIELITPGFRTLFPLLRFKSSIKIAAAGKVYAKKILFL